MTVKSDGKAFWKHDLFEEDIPFVVAELLKNDIPFKFDRTNAKSNRVYYLTVYKKKHSINLGDTITSAPRYLEMVRRMSDAFSNLSGKEKS